MTTHSPDASQQAFAEEPPFGNLLLIAPAGCGKTEALAYRARVLVLGGHVRSPRKLLALTYSNKARDSLSARMRVHLGQNWRESVTVTNFHGLAARVVQNHGNVLGLPRDLVLPDKTWKARRLRELGVDYRETQSFEPTLRHAKAGTPDDSEVLNRVYDSGIAAAIEFEEGLRRENRLDFDDLLRHARRLLSCHEVAKLYRAHFATVFVDEVQDLSLGHLRLVQGVANDNVTYAGDFAQGIYSFAGAQPNDVFAAVRQGCPKEFHLSHSYRHSPAVLRAVNAIAHHMGDRETECGDPAAWTDDGQVILLQSSDTLQEAVTLHSFVSSKLASGSPSLGLIARRSARLRDFRKFADDRGLDFTCWSTPTHVAQVVDLLHQHVRTAEAMGGDAVNSLRELCQGAIDPADALMHDEVAAACAELQDWVQEGSTLSDAIAKCRVTSDRKEPITPGVHLLTGHLGKGQEFDWVVVVGLEDGHIPDFRNKAGPELAEELRVLHVMVSRARYGVVLTSSQRTRTRNGWRITQESPWLKVFEGVITKSISAH